MAPRYPSIPDPTTDPQSLRDAVLALKQAFELMAGTRGNAAVANAEDLASASDTIATNTSDIEALQTAVDALSYVSSIEGASGALTLDETSGVELSGSEIQLRQGSASQFGALKVDNVTLQSTAGVASAKNPACTYSQPSPNPTGTSSGSPGKMMGLGGSCKITPVYSGRVEVMFDYGATAGGLVDIMAYIKYGTGTAPSNGASPSGTTLGGERWVSVYSSGRLSQGVLQAVLTGLTLNTEYWFDIALYTSSGITVSITGIQCVLREF